MSLPHRRGVGRLRFLNLEHPHFVGSFGHVGVEQLSAKLLDRLRRPRMTLKPISSDFQILNLPNGLPYQRFRLHPSLNPSDRFHIPVLIAMTVINTNRLQRTLKLILSNFQSRRLLTRNRTLSLMYFDARTGYIKIQRFRILPDSFIKRRDSISFDTSSGVYSHFVY